jgi:hypothetical protein
MFNRYSVGRVGRGLVATAAIVSIAGCLDLDVENTTAPDRERATGNPNDVLAFIGGAYYPTFHNAMNVSLAINLFPYASSEMTASLAGTADQQQARDLLEPRVAHNNGAQISQSVGPEGPRRFWASIGRAATIPYDGLQLIDNGMRLTENGVDVTDRARAFAKFMQGWSWGYAALIFEKAHVVPETVEFPAEPGALQEMIRNSLVPYDVAIEAAVSSLEEAIAIARRNPTVVFYPSVTETIFWFGSPTTITNAQFIGMANTLAARLLVLGTRTPQERAALDWNRVAAFTAEGVTEDFVFQLMNNRTNTFLDRIQNNTNGGTANGRWDYRTIGPADQSGAYQAWVAAGPEGRDRFDIVTPDRRITGPTPTSDGAYARYRADDNGFLAERGLYFRSAYQWQRHAIRNGLTGNNRGPNVGVHPLITADENNLLRAEALLRTGDAAGAADLINVSRTREHQIGNETYPGLPPVTAAGVPNVDGVCVPRLDSGACGDLLTAIRYERMIELSGTDLVRGYADSRGFGILADGSLLSWPVPGNVLQLYNLPEYTFGGVGTPGSATYAPATLP